MDGATPVQRRRPVTFQNEDGCTLFGILHEPAEPGRRDAAILLLSPGVKTRVAPHRMYNKMAERFVALGFTVFRFDFYGLGDSEGTVPEPMLAELYRSIQVGRYVHDTRTAIDWLRAQTGIPRVVVGGLCGGAITGVLTAAGHRQVCGVLGLGLPVILDGSRVDKVANMTRGQLDRVRGAAFRKLLKPAAWWRLLTLQSDYRLLGRSIFAPILKNHSGTTSPTATAVAPGVQSDNSNPEFPPAFRQMLARGCPALLVFSESDRLYWEFREKFVDRHGPSFERLMRHVDVRVVKDANHVFTFSQWQREMLDRCDEWLQATFPQPVEAVSKAAVVSRAGAV